MGDLVFGLTDKQHADRRTAIGGSHATKIMAGDWQSPWMEITGRAPSKKIMSDWNYVIRMMTEKLQLDWFEYKTGDRVIRRSDNAVCASYPFMRATLDGMVESTGESINAKHLSGWTKEARQWAIDKYWWQIVHETIVLAPPSMCGLISLIVGEKEPEVIPIEADPVSIDELLSAEEEFWQYVVRDEPPDGRAAMPPRPEEVLRTVDMAPSNSWAEYAAIWLETIGPSRKNKQAAEELRALVGNDVAEAAGHGVKITRSKDNKLMLKEAKNV